MTRFVLALTLVAAAAIAGNASSCPTYPGMVTLDAAGAALNPNHRGSTKRVVEAIGRAMAGCHDDQVVNGDVDHVRDATWALGSCERDAIVLLQSAWDEGHFCVGAGPSCPRGDNGHSVGTFQVQGWKDGRWDAALTDALEQDVSAQARVAYDVLRAGARSCPDEPLAPYCGGCGRAGARQMAQARLQRADELLESLDGD